jgi:hypothetical protein
MFHIPTYFPKQFKNVNVGRHEASWCGSPQMESPDLVLNRQRFAAPRAEYANCNSIANIRKIDFKMYQGLDGSRTTRSMNIRREVLTI